MTDTPLDTTKRPESIDLIRPKRQPKRVISRHPKAVAARKAAKLAKQGGEGVALARPPAPTIDPLASKILAQKELTRQAALARILTEEANARKTQGNGTTSDFTPQPPRSFTPLPDTDSVKNKWLDGSRRAAVYARPVNPRMLLVVFEDETHGQLIVSPMDKARFSIGSEVWATPDGLKGRHALAGRYNRFGRRVS